MTPKTIEAMKEARRGGLKKHASTKAMLKSMGIFDYERACEKIGEHLDAIEKAREKLTAEDLKVLHLLLNALTTKMGKISHDVYRASLPHWVMLGEKAQEREKERKDIEKKEQYRRIRESFKFEVRGVAVGEIWSNEFEQYRRNGAFEASLFDQLAKHAQPSEPIKVKDMVKGSELAKMIAEAEKQAGGKYTGQKS